jgi:hypothetical protein
MESVRRGHAVGKIAGVRACGRGWATGARVIFACGFAGVRACVWANAWACSGVLAGYPEQSQRPPPQQRLSECVFRGDSCHDFTLLRRPKLPCLTKPPNEVTCLTFLAPPSQRWAAIRRLHSVSLPGACNLLEVARGFR